MSRLVRIEIDEQDDVQFYFDEDPNLPFFVVEFEAGSEEHALMSAMESRLREFNKKYKPKPLDPGAMTAEQIEALMKGKR